MSELISILVLIALLGVIMLALDLRRGMRSRGARYVTHRRLLSPAERSFLGVLESVIGDDRVVIPKVRVADVLRPAKGMSRSEWQGAFNRIKAKHFDFVVCRKSDYEILGAIELDDKSHNRKLRQHRDAFLESAAESSGLPFLRFDTKASYTSDEIRQKARAGLNGDQRDAD